jgi:hypothetical protein
MWGRARLGGSCNERGAGGRVLSRFELDEGKDSDVFILSEGDGCLGGVRRMGSWSGERLEPVTAIKFVEGFKDAVCINGKTVARAEIDGRFSEVVRGADSRDV